MIKSDSHIRHGSDHGVRSEEPLACVDSVESFEHIVPLDIYGLEAGDYEYVLNDEFVGEFSLGVENVLGE